MMMDASLWSVHYMEFTAVEEECQLPTMGHLP